ncbi:G3E family GTPase [Pedobacter sp. UYP24]
MINKKIPVTVLTGFLGSGKTTLLNRILTEQHGKKIAVIENEFGEIGVDNELVIGADEEIFEMNNGCICCTVRGDLIRILTNLTKRKDRLDHIIIETTGLADPAPVAQTFFVDEEMQEQYQIDAIVTVVDAKHVWQHIDSSDECKQQIAFADVLLLNKTDLISPEELAILEQRIRKMNSQTKIYKTINCDLAIDKILDVKAFDLDAKVEINPDFMKEELPFEYAGVYYFETRKYTILAQEGPDPEMDLIIKKIEANTDDAIEREKKAAVIAFSGDPHQHRPGTMLIPDKELHQLLFTKSVNTFELNITQAGWYILFTQHHPDEFELKITEGNIIVKPFKSLEFEASHEHDNSVTSVGIEYTGDLDLKKFNTWISWVLDNRGVDIFRSKGIISVAGHDERFVFQGVHMLFDAQSDRLWKPGENRKSQIVFIGRNLKREELNAGFKECIAR